VVTVFPPGAYPARIHVVLGTDTLNLFFSRRDETTKRFANLKEMAGVVSTIARRMAGVVPRKVAYNSAGYGLPVNSETRHPGSGDQAVALGTAAPAAHVLRAAERDLGLIARVLASEKELFYELIRPYERPIYTAALSVMKNPHDAEEVCQEAVLKAFARLDQFRGESKFSTWLVQIVINEAKAKLRKDRRHLYESADEAKESEEGDYIPRDFADWREIPSAALERRELREAIARGLASLKPKYREVLVLRDIQKMNIRDTAQVLGITENSVKTRLMRARLMMRDALAPGFDGSWSCGSKEYKQVRPW
jgi:RNA polymerase sigma-70 factor (ECF subfamily)